jgi:hypothetical protein
MRFAKHTAVAVALAVAAIPVSIAAQQAQSAEGGVGVATYDYANGCFPFGGAFGAVNHFNVCVSSHGNIAKFDFHNSVVVENGTFAEGYVVCATVSGVARVYHDTMWSESGWGAAVSTSPGALPITVTRSTIDGAFTLTQTYARNTTEREWTITMKLKANVPVQIVKLVRTVDVDVDTNLTGSFAHNFDNSFESVWGSDRHAFTSQAMTRTISHSVSFAPFATVCDNAPAAGPVAAADLGATIQYNLGNMNAGNAKTVKVRYAGN